MSRSQALFEFNPLNPNAVVGSNPSDFALQSTDVLPGMPEVSPLDPEAALKVGTGTYSAPYTNASTTTLDKRLEQAQKEQNRLAYAHVINVIRNREKAAGSNQPPKPTSKAPAPEAPEAPKAPAGCGCIVS